MTIIQSIDPGGWGDGKHAGTGLTVLDTETLTILHSSIEKLNPYEVVQRFEELREKYQPDVLIAEDFIPRWGIAFSLEPVYLLGALLGMYNGALRLVKPSDHISLVSKERLTALLKEHKLSIGAGHSRMSLSLAIYWSAFRLQEEKAIHYLLGEQNV